MNKNIRRSIVIAAGVTGAWALGSTVAGADELPASTVTEAADQVRRHLDAKVPQRTDTVTDRVGDKTAATIVTVPTATVQTATVQTVTVQTVTVQTDDVEAAATSLGSPGDQIDYLFGPLTAFAPELEEALAADRTRFQSARSAAQGVVRQKAQTVTTGAARTADAAHTTARQTVTVKGVPTTVDATVTPVVDHAVGNAAALTGTATTHTTQWCGWRWPIPPPLPTGSPMTRTSSRTSAVDDVPPYASGLASHLVDDTVDAVLPPVVNTAVRGVVPVAGQAVEDAGGLAYGVTGDVAPFAYGVVGEVAPVVERGGSFGRDVGGTVGGGAGALVGNAVTGGEGVVGDVVPGYVPTGSLTP